MKPKRKNFTIVSNNVLRNPNLRGDDKIVYIILSSFNPSFPSTKKLTQLTGYGKNKLVEIKKRLITAGMIEQKRRWNDSNIYTIKDFVETTQVSQPNMLEVSQENPNKTKNILTAGETQENIAVGFIGKPVPFYSVIEETDCDESDSYSAEYDYHES